MKKYDVLCPHCCGTFLETNSHFREDGPANGSMFEPKQHIKDAGWSVFPLYDSTEYADITCPSCGGVLVDSLGKLLRTVVIGEIDPLPTVETHKQDIMAALMAEYDPKLPDDPKETKLPESAADIGDIMKIIKIEETPVAVIVKKPRKPRTTKPRGKK